jgi:hypothetical protein
MRRYCGSCCTEPRLPPMDTSRENQQLTLPLDLNLAKPEHREFVKQHWKVTFARQGKMSVMAKRIMARVLDQIRDEHSQLAPSYQVRVSDLIPEGASKEHAYTEVRGALRELMAAVWEFEDLVNLEWAARHLLDTRDIATTYKNGVVTLSINPALTPYFIEVSRYSIYELKHYMKLKSWYSMRLFEILSAWRHTGWWEVTIDEYRQYMDCWHQFDKRNRVKTDKSGKPVLKYPLVNNLIARTTTEALAELAGTDLAFKVHPVYEEGRATPGRKKIVRLRFELKKKPTFKIPESWLKDPVTKSIVDRMFKFKVSERNIATYGPILGRDGMNKILREWDLKQISDDRINDVEKYCNAALVRQGKQLSEEAQEAVAALIKK